MDPATNVALEEITSFGAGGRVTWSPCATSFGTLGGGAKPDRTIRNDKAVEESTAWRVGGGGGGNLHQTTSKPA